MDGCSCFTIIANLVSIISGLFTIYHGAKQEIKHDSSIYRLRFQDNDDNPCMGEARIGSQTFKMSFETGTNMTWIPLKGCNSCGLLGFINLKLLYLHVWREKKYIKYYQYYNQTSQLNTTS